MSIKEEAIQKNLRHERKDKMSELEKMKQGRWHDANNDEELLQKRLAAEDLCFLFNHTRPKDHDSKQKILRQLLPHAHPSACILAPFYADYGEYCFIGEHTFINHHAYLMDGGDIHIGAFCFIGPNCGIYTVQHPLCWQERDCGYERAKPITIGDHVWIGADVTILPGVTIHEGAIIGAKSVVTCDIPPHVIAVGNPCKILRPITEEDRISSDLTM